MDLEGRVAIVTGAGGRGSGRAIARRLAKERVSVVVSDIDEQEGPETVRRIESDGAHALFHRADVRVEAEIRALIDFATEKYGRLDILVNNASAKIFPERSLDEMFANVHVDLLGAMYGTRYAIEAMRRHGGGTIVNIGSTSALSHGGRPSMAPGYDTAKAGIMRLTTCLAPLADEGIRVNCLVPDWIATDDVRPYWESLTTEQRTRDRAPGVLTTVEEIAGAVVRLITDEKLAGRVMVWWSDNGARLIPFGDPGYAALE